MNLLQLGNFHLASGTPSSFKIECDSLTKDDWECAAFLASKIIPFGEVIGVPRGGLPFAEALQKYVTKGHNSILLVDDVWTTGRSMRTVKHSIISTTPVYGIVLFSRVKQVDSWVFPIFTMNVRL